MLKLFSVKLDEIALRDVERIAKEIGVDRNAYINRAVEFMNGLYERRLLSDRYRVDALDARASSLEVLREFESFLGEGLSILNL